MSQHFSLSTKLIHTGKQKLWTAKTRAVPLYQTGSYVFESAEKAAEAFKLDICDHLYGRLSNPTTDIFEKRVAAMDNGVKAVAFASGMAAFTGTILNICKTGDTLVSSKSLYGGTYVVFDQIFRNLGIKTIFVDPSDTDELEVLIHKHNPKLFFTESIGNPKNDIPDFDRIAKICQHAKIPFILDNTLTPGLIDPSKHGIDIVMYSASKYLSGHGLLIGGVVVDMGTFNWNNRNYPFFSEPDPSYNDMVFAEKDHPFALRLCAHMLRDFGGCLGPMNAFLAIIGLETLDLRMNRVCENARELAMRLNRNENIAWVNYPGIGENQSSDRLMSYFNYQCGGIVCFGLGTAEKSQRFTENLELITHMANMGDVQTLIQHCASTSHAQLNETQMLATGTKPDLLRLSVGIENVEDIWNDIQQALKRIG